MEKLKSLFIKNKVLIIGLLMAVALPLMELFKTTPNVTSQIIAFSIFTAGLSFLSNNLRGQWATIMGQVGTTLATYLTMQANGTVSWNQLILGFVIALLAALAPPAKSRGYEKTPEIQKAKLEGEIMVPTIAKP